MSSNMSSPAEFTIGKEDGRNSSRVLRPPGGEETTQVEVRKLQTGGRRGSLDTKERVFNVPTQGINEAATPQAPSTYASYATRNPITGEGFEGIELEKLKKKEGHEKDLVARNPITGEGFEGDQCPEKDLGKGAGPANPEAVFKPVQTSGRVRNPSGGKSSGIF